MKNNLINRTKGPGEIILREITSKVFDACVEKHKAKKGKISNPKKLKK